MGHTNSLKYSSFFQNANDITIPRNTFLSCSSNIKLELCPHYAHGMTRSIMKKNEVYTIRWSCG